MRRLFTLAFAFIPLVLYSLPSLASDHVDSPAAVADAPADITDLFAWTSTDGNHVNLIMNVQPFAGSTAKFSDVTEYVFHVASMQQYGATTSKSTTIVCTFKTDQTIQCWAGNEYLTGDASNTAGISTTDGKLKVFAGRRNDPFFFNEDGFTNAITTVRNAEGSLTFDGNGCPQLDSATSTTLVTDLKTAKDGSAAQDFFSGDNVLSIVVQVDKSLVDSGGDILAVWGSTNKTP